MGNGFRERLKVLMKGERPYTWTSKVGIGKGLFQHYWKKDKIPSFNNLMKIHRYTGCSFDWLLMGKCVSIEMPEFASLIAKPPLPDRAKGTRFTNTAKQIKKLYENASEEDLVLLERVISIIHEGPGKKKAARKA